jgi:hypothetical protein
VLPKKPDHPPLAPVDTRPFKERTAKELVEQLRRAVSQKGYSNVKVYTDEADLVVEFENVRYLSDKKAVGRVMRIAYLYAPEDTRNIVVISKRLNLHVLRVSAPATHVGAFFQGKVSTAAFSKHLDIEMANVHDAVDPSDWTVSDDYTQYDLFFGIKPGMEPYLNDLAGAFKYRFSMKPYAKYFPWKGGMLYSRYVIPIQSTVSTNLPPPPEDTIRMDLVDYLQEDPTFDRFLFDQMFHVSKRTFARMSAGYFESMYAGVGGEILTFPGEGTFAFSLEADWARKREPATLFDLKDLDVYSVLGNIYYSWADPGIVVRAQVGQFLAEDRGVRFVVSREYDSGAIVGAWYSITDTDDLTGVNRNYNDKGVFLAVPVEIFKTTSDPRRWIYAVSPWTRDVGQTVRKDMEVYNMNLPLTPYRFKHNLGEMKE